MIFVALELWEIVAMVLLAVVILLILKISWIRAKKYRDDHQPHITFRDLEGGERVAVLHVKDIPDVEDLDKLFNKALDRLALDGDVSDEDYSLALTSYQTFQKERNA